MRLQPLLEPMQSQASVEIDAPINEVFRLTNDCVAEWSVIVVEDEVVDDRGGVGTRFRTVTEENGRRMEFDGVVTRYDPPHASAVQMTGAAFDIGADYTFEKLSADRTRVTQTSSAAGKGVFKLVLWLTGWLMRKSHCEATQRELDSLKRFCEGHAGAAG